MKKILFVIPSLSNGGAEKVVSKISSGLVNKGYDVTILNFYACEDEYSIDEKVKRINISNGTEEDYKNIGILKRFRLLRKYIKVIQPNDIFCFLNHVSIYVFLSLLFTKYRKKITFTERNNFKFANKKEIIVKKIFQKFIKRIIVQNSGQQKLLSNTEYKKSYIIANPIDDKYLNYHKELNNSPKHIVSIGRFVNQKDYPLAINAFSKLVKKYPDLIYHIYGKGKDKEKIENQIKELDLALLRILIKYMKMQIYI